MDMQIDSVAVKRERSKRAWSQSHLAEVTGLSLRTIQRIEMHGVGSLESIKALAAVFELSVLELSSLEVVEDKEHNRHRFNVWRWLLAQKAGVLAGIAMTLAGIAIFPAVSAQQVSLDVAYTEAGLEPVSVQVTNTPGRQSEILDAEKFRVLLSTEITANGEVAIAGHFYLYQGSDYVLVGQPNMYTLDQTPVRVELQQAESSRYVFTITPRIID